MTNASRSRPPSPGSARALDAGRVIGDNPGIKVSELGKKMKLNHPNYLYRVLPELEKEGRVRREGTGYHPG
jgi:DNA-binding IclR family transcriptional regulator